MLRVRADFLDFQVLLELKATLVVWVYRVFVEKKETLVSQDFLVSRVKTASQD